MANTLRNHRLAKARQIPSEHVKIVASAVAAVAVAVAAVAAAAAAVVVVVPNLSAMVRFSLLLVGVGGYVFNTCLSLGHQHFEPQTHDDKLYRLVIFDHVQTTILSAPDPSYPSR